MNGRRQILKTILGCGLACAVAPSPARAQAKRTKAQVHYQDKPKDVRSCGTCSYFTKPDGCTVVEGKVSRDGFCDLYAMVD